MTTDKLEIYKKPNCFNPPLLIGLSGWMDGGEVSTGTFKCLIDKLKAVKFAEIKPRGFYVFNIPGSMEFNSLFRPYTKIKDGQIVGYEIPTNTFYYSSSANLVLLLGKEPNLLWEEYAECIFTLCTQLNIDMIYFIGSVAGLVPHTREPRLFCSVSNEKLKDTFRHYGVHLTNYEGPASVITYLTASCAELDINMVSMVATVPAYVQGNNPKCIAAITKRLAGMLKLQVELDDMQALSDEFERKLNEIVQAQPELATNISKLEEDYDNEIFNNEMGELKNWLQQQGIKVD
jgi:proteasome assembly chaperone (PAC2) family protein